ncbi:hypothetical protein DOM22_09275 [Bdellovibrio sp. ZAP7]|uniref:glycosyltransferase 87 family protein n=1 Tax=Bdellovibrio sp. ZAP7 TaxID=2231053 RepID=UPI00115A2261|nr:glycosyltransferase 87 family protein [Bdellovibrio sp. ZAP7]QDK45329.1 hypothetical protein DOM22_09275 [Bdellovibrio sp. ZAP7]
MINRKKTIGEFIFLFVIIAAFIQSVIKLMRRASTGWDHEIYCKASEVWSSGLDPYIAENLGMKLSYSYPALFLTFYQYLCSIKFIFIYIDILLIGVIVWLLVRKLSSSLIVALPVVLLGYNSTYSNIETGNLGVVEAFLLTLALVFTVQKKNWSSIFLVPMAFLKIVPSMLALPIWFSSPKWKDRAIQFIVFVGGMISLIVANIIFSKELALSFFRQLTGGYLNQHSPANEMTANASNPTVLLFFKNLAMMFTEQYWFAIFVILVAGLAALTYWVWKNTIRNEASALYRLCWSYLLILMWIPRLKPYALILLCVAMVPLLSRVPRRFAFWIFFVTVFHRVLNGTKNNEWWELISNNTAIYTMIAVLILLTLQWRKQRQTSKDVDV